MSDRSIPSSPTSSETSDSCETQSNSPKNPLSSLIPTTAKSIILPSPYRQRTNLDEKSIIDQSFHFSTLTDSILAADQIRWKGNLPTTSIEAKQLRQAEFQTGNNAALLAMRQLGLSNAVTTLERNPDRSPAWPAGYVGSISHSQHWVWAVTGRADDFRSIGIDTEPIVSDDRAVEMSAEIGRPDEWEILQDCGLPISIAFTLLFSAKESFFKCCYPLTRQFLEFLDVRVTQIDTETLATAAIGETTLGRVANDSVATDETCDSAFLPLMRGTIRVTYCGSTDLKPSPGGLVDGLTVDYQLYGADLFTLTQLPFKNKRPVG